MFNQRNNPFTRGQNNNNNQQRPPPQQPHQQIHPNINNFETINVPNGVTTYISNRRNGNQWEHTEYETQPVPQEIQRHLRCGKIILMIKIYHQINNILIPS